MTTKEIGVRRLTKRQAAFVRYYVGEAEGDAVGAYKMAYPNANHATCKSASCALMKDTRIKQAIALYGQDATAHGIATRDAVMKFHSGIMRGEDPYGTYPGFVEIKDRARSAEILTRMRGGFLDHVKIDETVEIKDGDARDRVLKRLRGEDDDA